MCAKCVLMDKMMAIVFALGVVLISVLLLSVGVMFRKDKEFRSQHISQNKKMKEKGIHCAVSQDREARKKRHRRLKVKNL